MRAHQATFPVSVMCDVLQVSRSGVYAWLDPPSAWEAELTGRTDLVLAALDMAVAQRKPDGVVHHSDHGCQPGFNRPSQR